MTQVELADSVSAEIVVGDELVIRLPENRTTGYFWSVRDLGDELELCGDEFAPESSGPGTAEVHLFRIRAVRPGRTEVVLDHARDWEKTPVERRNVRVTVTS